MSGSNPELGPGLLEQRPHGKERIHDTITTTATVQSLKPINLPYPSSRLAPCAIKFSIAVALAGVSGYLISEIPHTPGLTMKMVILSGLGIFGACTLTVLAMRDAVCRLIIDDYGVRIAPLTFGQIVEWSQVSGWRMVERLDAHIDRRQLIFWVHGAESPRVIISIDRLSYEARRSIRRSLLTRLGEER